MTSPQVHGIFDPATWTVTYVVHSGPGSACAIIDSVLDYDPKSGRTRHTSAEKVIDYVQANQLAVMWILETHAHADHMTAAPYLKSTLGGITAIGDHITSVQKVFKGIFNLEPEFKLDGSQFDHLFLPDEQFQIGELSAKALYVPGHTPACMAYKIGDAVFVGDTLFMPDVGTARCDFPGGDASTLYASTRTLLNLPPETKDIPGFRFIAGTAINLPYQAGDFDLIYSNSVIEHVGSKQNQEKFSEEVHRVCDKYIVQTPSLWFPLEPHSLIPLFQFIPHALRAFLIMLVPLYVPPANLVL